MSWEIINAKLELISESLSDKIDTCVENQTTMMTNQTEMKVTQVKINVIQEGQAEDLATHIRRTNIMEGKLQKMVYLLILGAGIGAALYGPEIIKIIGPFL